MFRVTLGIKQLLNVETAMNVTNFVTNPHVELTPFVKIYPEVTIVSVHQDLMVILFLNAWNVIVLTADVNHHINSVMVIAFLPTVIRMVLVPKVPNA